MNEWEFTGDVSSWINQLLDRTPIPPFKQAKIEQTGSGSQKRRDLSILDKSRRPILTGEIKLPYRADGNSPYISKVVKDARKKARRAKARFFFTWNVNECVLWETDPADPSKLGQDYKVWTVTSVHNETQLEHRATEEDIRDWLVKFLHAVAQILEGTAKIGRKPPDEKFIDALESSLRTPIQFCYDELDRLYQRKRERARIDKWMREDQGWIIYADPDGIRENLDRASRFACYALVNKLVFHEALLRRYGRRLKKLRVPEHIDTGEKLWAHLEKDFKAAIKVTGDYETVFGEKHISVGNRIPFHSDEAVPHWRTLIDEIHDFDFSKLDHEVIGSLFERLLSPEERHKYGQYYTRVEIVDLINSFCIRNGNEKVMDPSCGGGTFLVRAYARMRALMPGQAHGEILKNLFGVDIMDFATHLTTINLAVRDLIDDENYPQIVRSDFFDVQSDKVFATLPRKVKSGGLGKVQQRDVKTPELDAIIGNPPYIRQEEIPKAKKPWYKELVQKESSVTLSGRSDIHCYFWPHATTFLKKDGYLCLLTSSQWLDVEYGFKLQEWILRNFEIHAIFESIDEPWFVGARVATTVTILKRQTDESKRMKNTVRFVQLRRPMGEILANDGTVAGAILAADEFRDEILSTTENTVNERYRSRLVRQEELWNAGVELGSVLGKTDGKYYGGKWGVHLRAPDLWFELLELTANKWGPLGNIADVRRGLTSGCDDFFYVRDITGSCLSDHADPVEFEQTFGVKRDLCKSGRIALVSCGEKQAEIKPIETRFLEPEIHSLMEVSKFSVNGTDCNRMVLLAPSSPKIPKNTWCYKYIKWGESQGFHRGSTCAARVSENREWFDVTGHRRAPCLWPKERQYRHVAPANHDRLIANCRLYEIHSPEKFNDPDLWGALLNSSWCLLSSLQYGRPMGNEGNWSTMVVDVNMMLVPDPFKAPQAARDAILKPYKKMMSRKVIPFLSERRLREMAYSRAGKEKELLNLDTDTELDMPDRRELDEATLGMLGVKSKKYRKELVGRLYAFLGEHFENTRQKEEKAIANKNLTKRRGRQSFTDIADQIFEEIQSAEKWLFQQYDPDFIDTDELYDTYDIPEEGAPEKSADMFNGNVLTFVKGNKRNTGHLKTRNTAQDNLISLLTEDGLRSLQRVPYDSEECERVCKEYERFIKRRDKKLRELVAERTSDEDLQEKIFSTLKERL